ncbi:cytochrome P450 [Obba rivulosa]|uniref:Cytochrome P450 n=1 Tax=Obba rivulosa TaxID=1052685 RepID=A0A8E2DFN3_9APHY|nr:cytochrome P450 [Obba rivulosa]
MGLISVVAWPLTLAGSAYILYKVSQILLYPWFSHLRYIPGPPSASFFYGNLKQLFNADNAALHEEWAEKYGNTLRFNGFLNMNRLYTMDLRAINYILTHSMEYPKPKMTRFFLSKILGEGVLFAEGEEHRQQRRVINPAFGPAQIRELTSIFVDKAIELRDFWDSEIPKTTEPARINVFDGLTKTTLNIIGLAGFNYEFDALNPEKNNELMEAFNVIFSTTDERFSIMPILQARLPFLRGLPGTRLRRFEEARDIMRRIGMQLVQERKATAMKSLAGEKTGGIERKDLHGRDLLTTLIKANMATDLPENLRLSDEDVFWQVPTFLVAGHETTSSAVTWCLYALTQAPEVQQKLREELFTLRNETPMMDELNSLPYLDAVVRETLRVYAPVTATVREATKDDVLPLATPYTDIRGQVHETLRVDKGTTLMIPILSINRSKALWGEDALEFRPERWECLPEAVSEIPGLWGNILTFIGGPRSCVGYRFALVEMKALIFILLRAFEFKLAVPADEIQKKSRMVQRPMVKSEMDKGNQMPLLVKRHQRI